MTNERRVLVHPDTEALAASASARFTTKAVDLLRKRDTINVVLTGGTIGIRVLEAVNASPARDVIDWSRVHFWWGDERWVPKADSQRNDLAAERALLAHIDVPEANVHPFAASDEMDDAAAAAATYAGELAAYAPRDESLPRFDITFLGVGADGHIASLFPDHDGIRETEKTVLDVHGSPKPPPDRLTLSRKAINSSDRLWLVLSGAEKASALGLALAGASYLQVPVAGAKGRKRTVFFVDREAAAEVPESLIADSY